jgi:hypothetical protein
MPDSSQEAKFQNQAEMLANRVKKRFRHLRKRFARQRIDVFRLYDWDIPEIRAVVDWYGGHLVVGEYTRRQSVPEWLPMVGAAVGAALGVLVAHGDAELGPGFEDADPGDVQGEILPKGALDEGVQNWIVEAFPPGG